jgi:hypothetical protein
MRGRGRLKEPRRWLSWGKRVASRDREVRRGVDARRDASWLDRRRVLEAMPPRKASRQIARARTENQHRWTTRK